MANVRANAILLMLLIAPTLCFGEEDNEHHATEVVIRADHVKASIEALKDFSSRLDKQVRQDMTGVDPNFIDYISRIENYDVEVNYENLRYTVWIHPRISKDSPAVFGGDAVYTIDSATYRLLGKRYGK